MIKEMAFSISNRGHFVESSQVPQWYGTNKDTFMRWKTSTFSTTNTVTGTSKVDMKEFWIGPKMFAYELLQQGFETAVNDYVSMQKKIKIQEYTHFRINCYETGGFMKEHIDNILFNSIFS